MRNEDAKRFAEALYGAMEVVGGRVTDRAMSVWWEALKPYPIESVVAALEAHVRQSVYPPKPADVIAAIAEQDGRPGPEEAWGIALGSRDEAATVVWTDEIATAMGACREILEAGDEVGARMAFKEAYEREVRNARAQQVPVRWSVSLGHDKDQRAQVVRDAVERGRIASEQAQKLLPEAITVEADGVARLESDQPAAPDNEQALAHLRALRESVSSATSGTPAPAVDAESVERSQARARRWRENEQAEAEEQRP